MQPDQAQLDELVRRIVDAVHPLRIILFGSAARGEMGADSDVDVMVVVPEGTPERRTAMNIYPLLFGVGVPIDLLVTTPSYLQEYGAAFGSVHHEVLQEGRELYAA
jgi:predicted nucleotidyltransferase